MPAADPNSFFPIDVKFTANKTFCDIKVLNPVVVFNICYVSCLGLVLNGFLVHLQVGSVVQTQNNSAVKFGKRTQLVVESYQVV